MLNFFHRYAHNYGVAIILVTVVVKILFYPLTHKSMKSMTAMQRLQPQMKTIREKYRKDPQAMNKEMMALYKKHGVNPMGGCLPILFQIPVFWALYKVLAMAIELRQAPFVLWITDLSVADPWKVTPILMGVSMFAQQKMTPTATDPRQAQMMLFLPVVFTFFFLNFPSGLVLYWLTNNLLTIAQQYFIRRRLEPAPASGTPKSKKGKKTRK
jgi:YidC/Oxa1 family membrane protein insertase